MKRIFREWSTVVVFAALTSMLLPAMAVTDSSLEDGAWPINWLSEMERYYDDHPELKETKSSGWKPFNRVKWFVESRLDENGNPPSADARWRVWEERKVREREQFSKSPAQNSWFQIGPANLSGRILAIEFDPTNTDIIYVGSASGGLWKSTDHGLSWATATDELPTLAVGAVCVLPWDTDVVLMGTGEGNGAGNGAFGVGILKSTDAGETWNTTSLSYPVTAFHGFNAMEANPNTGTILAGARDGVWRSTDDGDTWTQVRNDGRFYDVKWKPGAPATVFVAKGFGAGANTIKVSTDDGLTWAKAGTGQPPGSDNGQTKLDICASNPDIMYAHYTSMSSSATIGIYRSDDGAATWNPVYTGPNMTGGQGWYNLTLAVDPNDPDRVISGGVSLYESSNAGTTFSVTGGGLILGDSNSVHLDHHAIAYEPGNDSTVWVGNDGGVWRSTDDGATWASRREGLVTYQFYDICVAQDDPAFMMGGTQDNGVPGRVGFDDWFTSTLLADGMVCNISPGNADQIFAEWQFGNHVKSNNGGGGWTPIMAGITGSGAWVAPVDQDQEKAAHLFTSTSTGIFRTHNRGTNWTNVGSQSAIWISISMVDSLVTWTVNSGGPWVTTDDGGSWTKSASYGFSVGSETKVHAHPTDVASAFVSFGSYSSTAKLALTTDYGQTWSNVTGNLPSNPVNTMIADPTDPDSWYVGTDVGVWRSTDGGTTWDPFETGLPNAVITDLEIRRATRKLVAGTFGRGAWEVALPASPTSVADNSSSGGAVNLMLDPPSPNPVQETTLFRFAARHEGSVTLDVYDVRGRLVDHVADVTRGDGIIRTVTWDAGGVPSGVYFAQLAAGDMRKARRIVVTK